MGGWKLWFVQLLLLPFCTVNKVNGEHLVKTIGKEPDATQVCNKYTLNDISLLVCKIRTARSWGEECRLVYQHGLDFEYKCDSRFRFITKNQVVFLHLTHLTPEDSGNYTCECSYNGGTHLLHLDITVGGDEEAISPTQTPFFSAATGEILFIVVTGVAVFIIITGVILGLIYRKIRLRRQQQPMTSHPNTEVEDIEPYSVFMQKENGLYATTRIHSLKRNNSDVVESHDTNLGMSL